MTCTDFNPINGRIPGDFIAILVSLTLAVGASFSVRGADEAANGVQRLIAEASAKGVFSFVNDRQGVNELRSLGMRRASDLVPYLARPGLDQRTILHLMEELGSWDGPALQAVERIARDAPSAELRSLATQSALMHLPRDKSVELGISVVDSADPNMLFSIMNWIGSQNHAWLSEDPNVSKLVRRVCNRMRALLQPEARLKEVTFALSAGARTFPFDEEPWASEITETLLVVLEHPQKLMDYDIQSAFTTIARNADSSPKLVEDGLVGIVREAPVETTKVLLWQVFSSKFSETDIGRRVIGESLKRWPQLKTYVERLGKTTYGVNFGDDPEVNREVQMTLRKLWGWSTP